jgi:IS5 family transposase
VHASAKLRLRSSPTTPHVLGSKAPSRKVFAAFELRQARYRGLAKTHLQHVATATAMNLVRLSAWLQGLPRAQTRRSHFAALAA